MDTGKSSLNITLLSTLFYGIEKKYKFFILIIHVILPGVLWVSIHSNSYAITHTKPKKRTHKIDNSIRHTTCQHLGVKPGDKILLKEKNQYK